MVTHGKLSFPRLFQIQPPTPRRSKPFSVHTASARLLVLLCPLALPSTRFPVSCKCGRY